jgi:peptidoglycan hydrolase-like protein with peptidoglycan-binding domain
MSTPSDSITVPGLSVGARQAQLTQLGYSVPAKELKAERFGPGTREAVQQFQQASGLEATGDLDTTTAEALSTAVAAHTYSVTGNVQSPALPGVAGATVRLVDKNVGGEDVLGTTKSGIGGAFSFSLVISPEYLARHSKSQPDLQVQVMTGESVLASSEVNYSAPRAVSLNVVVPAAAEGLPSEYETLTASLASAYSGGLGELQEDADREDITYLANKTGWDARMVALAALADQFSQIAVQRPRGDGAQETEPAAAAEHAAEGAVAPAQTAGADAADATVRPEFYYALFRAGLPANAETLFQVSPATVQGLWQQAITQGVIPQALSKELPAAVKSFQTLSAAKLLTATPAVGVSTFSEMAQAALPRTSDQEQFAQLYLQYADDPDTLWPAVEKALGADSVAQLQGLGKLNYLTINNQPLVEALTKAASENEVAAVSAPVDLVTRGYYESSAWAPLIAAGSVPAQIPGADASEQASNYADLMAAQIRLAYPTAVLADQVRRGTLPITDTDAVASEVVEFLGAHQGEFEVGVEPIEAFVARTGAAGPSEAALAQVKRLQRAYQLTPDDTSLAVLLNHNLDSAYAITRYDPEGFVRTFSAQLGGEDTANLIHARARQIFVSVLSLAAEYLKLRVTPKLGGASPVQVGDSTPAGAPPASVVAYPTLEGLFGSFDYCSCSECSSILSPAAYFVDLLHFIDQPAPSASFENPQEVLFARRPDLQYLNLTCANTDTALPYIDIVNETLEYFVANDLSIEGYEGHDTGEEITSAELIASPQYVNDDAYAVLEGAFFPSPLPFNRPLTLLRLQLQGMGIELPAAMQALRANDELTNSNTPTSYGWRDILIEQLGVSREEYHLFTGSLELGQLYGLPSNLTASQQLDTLRQTSLQEFTRRLGVSYDAFATIVQTQFINPDAALIPLLEKLDCTFATLEALEREPLDTSVLPAGLDATLFGATTDDDYGAIAAWVTSNYSRIVDIITITNTSGNAEDCSGADLFFRYTNPAAAQLSGSDFRKLILFVRLWRKLTPLLAEGDEEAAIQDTDRVLAALYPPADAPLASNGEPANQKLLEEGFATLLPRLGFLVQIMTQLSLSAESSLEQLLACWAPIGTLGTDSLYASMFLTPTLLQQDPGATTATVSATVSAGDILTTTFNPASGVLPQVSCEVQDGQSAATVATRIAALINNCAAIDPATQVVHPLSVAERYHATSDGGVITMKAGFALACGVSPAGGATYAPPLVPANSLLANVGGAAQETDVLTTTIDGVAIPYTASVGATAESIAAGIAVAINAAAAPMIDPLSGEAVNQAFSASSSGAIVIVTQASRAGFTLECSSSSATEVYTSQSPICQTASIAGTLAAGDVLTTEIDTVAIPYTVLAGDTPEAAASAIAVAINATTRADPYSGLPLNDLVVATASGATVTMLAVDAGAPFALACSLTPPVAGSAQASSYTATEPVPAHWTATISGAVKQGDTLETTINGVTIAYAAVAGDSDATALAGSIAATISAATELEAASRLPLSAVVQASSAAGVITITAVDPATAVVVACKVSSGAESYIADGPVHASAVATVVGSPPAGATLTTTINGVPVPYPVQSSLPAAKIAEGVAQAINDTKTADPITGTPLNKLLVAVASQDPQGEGLVTVTAASPTTPFSIEATATASGYKVGRQPAPFAGGGSGEFLTDPTQTLFGHEPTLCAACNITGAEFQLIVEHLGYGPNATLSLGNVSELFRYGWLAHTLELSVEELILLIKSTGLEPFESLDPGTSPAPVEPAMIRLARLLAAMSAAGLSTDQALYLMWNQDISGDSAPPQSDVGGLAIALRAAFATVEGAFAVQDDPSGSIAEGMMTLVYGATTTDFFFGLLNGTFTTSVAYSAPTGVSSIPQAIVEAAGGGLGYDSLAKQLTFDGVLDSVTQGAIAVAVAVATTATCTNSPGLATFTPASMQNIYPGSALSIDTGAAQETVVVIATTQTTFTASTLHAHNGTIAIANDPSLLHALARLAAANQQVVEPFFASHPELQPLFESYANSSASPQEKRTALLASFLPILIGERKRQQALASVMAAAGTDQSFAAALLQDASVLHADADPSAQAVSDFTAIARPGLSARFFLTNDPVGNGDLQAEAAPALSYSQTATVAAAIGTGAVLETKIGGVDILYTVPAGATPDSIAAGIAAAINVTTTLVGGVPLNQAVLASASDATVAIARAELRNGGYLSLECLVSGAASPLYEQGTQLPPAASGGEIAAIWSGYVTVPQSGVYEISVAADEGATVKLEIDGEQVLGAPVGGLWSNDTEVSLQAGVLTPIVLSAESIATTLSVAWHSQGTGWQAIPGECLYSLELLDRLGNTYARFLKATSLAGALSLSAAEIASLGTGASVAVDTASASKTDPGMATFAPASMANIAVGSELVIDGPPLIPDPVTGIDRPGSQETVTVARTEPAMAPTAFDRPALGEGWINALAGDPADSELAAAHDLTGVLTGLLDFARIKQALSPNDGRLLAVLQEPAAKLPNGQYALLSLTGWSQESLTALLTQFFPDPGFSSLGTVESFRRVYDAFALVTASRLGASALISAITNAPSSGTVGTLQSALRSQYAPADWLTVVTPISNAARIAQRDALVAYIVQQEGDLYAASGGAGAPVPVGPAISTSDDLYAYLMIDPENEPAVLTSRILLATLTVQLFIERIIRDLEPQAAPADINRSQWEWMKRYRVWQANREVFLWPENWLYPELRDNQSGFFQTTMSTLLQGDIDEESARSAYLDYLTNLEEVAKLEACGMYYEPATSDSDETAIVVSRTAGAHRKYYVRELSSGSWDPWREAQIDCEDLPLTPIVWNGRLFLFWLKVVKQTVPASLTAEAGTELSGKRIADFELSELQKLQAATKAAQNSVAIGAVLCWSEYYNGKWQPTKTSDVNLPTSLSGESQQYEIGLGLLPATGSGSFEQAIRGSLRLVPVQFSGNSELLVWFKAKKFTLPSDALILAIARAPISGTLFQPPFQYGGFVLHNTHSLPVRLDDMFVEGGESEMVPFWGFLDLPSPSRTLSAAQSSPPSSSQSPFSGASGDGTFSVLYENTLDAGKVYDNEVLDFGWSPRFTEPQPGLPWSAPFIYEDRRNIFYVNTKTPRKLFSAWGGFGIPSRLAGDASIAKLVLRSEVATPAVSLTGAFTQGDAGVVQRHIAQAPRLNAALSLPTTVTYQGRVIDPTGSIPESVSPAEDDGKGE